MNRKQPIDDVSIATYVGGYAWKYVSCKYYVGSPKKKIKILQYCYFQNESLYKIFVFILKL